VLGNRCREGHRWRQP